MNIFVSKYWENRLTKITWKFYQDQFLRNCWILITFSKKKILYLIQNMIKNYLKYQIKVINQSLTQMHRLFHHTLQMIIILTMHHPPFMVLILFSQIYQKDIHQNIFMVPFHHLMEPIILTSIINGIQHHIHQSEYNQLQEVKKKYLKN